VLLNFRLTVTDSDGESDSTTATVTVNDGKVQSLIPMWNFSLPFFVKNSSRCIVRKDLFHLWRNLTLYTGSY